MNPNELIMCHHPKAGGEAEFTREAFELVWKSLGWEEGPLVIEEGGSGDTPTDQDKTNTPRRGSVPT